MMRWVSLFLLLSVLSVPASAHSVLLNWAAPADFVAGDFYNVYRGTVSGGPYTVINSAPVTSITFTDLGVADGNTYYYVVTHARGTLESKNSNQVQAIIPAAILPPKSLTRKLQ